MNRLALLLAGVACALSATSLLRARPAPDRAAPVEGNAWKAERHYPPLVFTSQAWLDCSISSTSEGRQTMTTTSGPGFTFTTAMNPIKDGTVEVKAQGMRYQFTSYPTGKVAARFGGLGDGTITEMKAEVEVDVDRFNQLKGPGTAIRFNSADIRRDAAYVEFTGVFVRTRDQKRFPFRAVFGPVEDGEGEIVPGGPESRTQLLRKNVQLGSRTKPVTVTTAMYEAEDDTPALR